LTYKEIVDGLIDPAIELPHPKYFPCYWGHIASKRGVVLLRMIKLELKYKVTV
jgi:hypothetical protein